MSNTIKLPTDTTGHVASLDEATLSKVAGDKRAANSYLEAVLDASRLTMTGDILSGMEVEVEDHIPYESGPLTSAGHFPSDVSGKTVTGRSAIIRAQSRIGRGVPVPVMLPHCGIWVTVMPPSESELLTLWTSMLNDKIQLGRFTYGAIFSATSIVTQQRMIDFVLEHVESTTVSLKGTKLTLKDVIREPDIGPLLNGMGIAMYPRGIEYESPCVANPSECAHVTKGTLQPSSLLWYTSSRIPESIKGILANRVPESVGIDNLNLYSSTLLRPKKITLTDETGMPTDIYLEVPTINRSLKMGNQWIAEIHDSVVRAMGIDQTPTDEDIWTERNLSIIKHGKASFLRQYAAYVTKIDLYEAGIVEDNEQDLAEVLTVMSGSDKLRTDMIKAIEEYIADTTNAYVGIPAHACPSCGKKSDIGGNHIIALDPVRLFFKYLVVRVDQISQRSLL